MKNTKEIAETVFKIRDEQIQMEQARTKRFKRTASVCGAVCCFALVLTAWHFTKDNVQPSRIPTPNDSAVSPSPTNGNTNTTNPNANNSNLVASASEQSITETIPSGTHQPTLTQTDLTSEKTHEQSTISSKPNDGDESVLEPVWDDKSLSEQYPEFLLYDKTYGLTNSIISPEHISEQLNEFTVDGYDIYTDTTHTITATAYHILDISDFCAIAVSFAGSQNYYVYLNQNYSPDTLGEVVDALNLNATLSFGSIYLPNGAEVQNYEKSVLYSLLNDNRNCRNVSADNAGVTKLSVSTNLEMLGILNKSFAITEDGYITTNIMGWGYAFYIGEDAVNEAMERLNVPHDAVPSVSSPMDGSEEIYAE